MFEKASPDEPRPDPRSLEMVALRVSSEERVLVLRRLWSRFGIRPDEQTEHTSYFRDPEGRRIAVSCFDFSPWLEHS